jgi:O-antigen/teichoic acid export membrane protein
MSSLLLRVRQSAVVWFWATNLLRLGSYFILLPLLGRTLSGPDFGFYWVLVNLAAVVPLLDLGFVTAIDRSLSYAMGGATELKAHGVPDNPASTGAPNFALLWRLLLTTSTVYRLLSAGVLVVLGAWGTFVTSLRVSETSSASHTWWAWGLTLIGAVFEIYSGWWNAYLRGLNKVVLCARIQALALSLRLLLAATLLLVGGGLLSVPIATFISSFLQRQLSRRHVLRFLPPPPSEPPSRAEKLSLLRTLWPNSWRVGVHCLSHYFVTHANTILCLTTLGLAATAQYGLSLQILTILQGLAGVWLQVKWPLIGQYLTRLEIGPLRQVLRTRLALQCLTFLVMASVSIPLVPNALNWIHTDKSVLDQPWLALFALNAFFEMHFNSWTTFISIGNRLPFLAHTVAANFVSVILAVVLLHSTSLGVGALVLSPLIVGLLFNYWYWPLEGLNMLRVGWRPFLFSKPC